MHLMEAISKHLIKALISQDKAAPLIGCLHDGRGVFAGKLKVDECGGRQTSTTNKKDAENK